MAWSERLIIVIPAARQAVANGAAKHVEWDAAAGENTFTVGLSPTGLAPATHYWCNAALTPTLLVGVGNRLRASGATVAEATPLARSATPQAARLCVFDAADWGAEDVLSALGLKRVATPR